MATKVATTKSPARGYRMSARGSAGEIYLYGIIGQTYYGDGVSAQQFSDDLKSLGKVATIDVRINSDGGDVFEGRTIYSLLNQHPARITIHVDGLAASIASLIAMAGDEIQMGDGTFMMVHNAWGRVDGGSDAMRRQADLIDSVSATLAETYVARTKKSVAEVQAWMDDETWMSAAEAVERGFADKITDPVRVAAAVRRPENDFRHLPVALRRNRVAAEDSIRRIAALLKSA